MKSLSNSIYQKIHSELYDKSKSSLGYQSSLSVSNKLQRNIHKKLFLNLFHLSINIYYSLFSIPKTNISVYPYI